MTLIVTTKPKVYQGVLQQIRLYIEKNRLGPGDKLPSERELSEKLQAGRSSVREALRALELLGIIETRTGEGTFIANYESFQTLDILASFVLSDPRIRRNLLETKRILEREAAKQACSHLSEKDISVLKDKMDRWEERPYECHLSFFSFLFAKTENLLMLRIWQLMEEYSSPFEKQNYTKEFYGKLLQYYREKNVNSIESLFTRYEMTK